MSPPRGRRPGPPARRPLPGRGGRDPVARRPPAARERGLGGEQVEGRRAVRELLAARRRRVRDVWMVEDALDSPLLAEIADLAAAQRVPVRHVSRGKLEAESRSFAPQGVLAHAAPLPEADLEDLCRRASGKRPAPFLLALDGVTDPQNLGALLRTAEIAGVTGVVLPRHRAVHVTPTVAKAAAGAVEHLPMTVVPGLPAALSRLGQLGVWTIGLEAEATDSVFELTLAGEPVALVLGAEGSGLSPLARKRCDVLAAIPQFGRLGSLNVAAAAAVACYEIARRRAQTDR